MNIEIKGAKANNLKNISVDVPMQKITAFTGVSGSGKSTLLKNIIAAYGYRNFTRISTKTIRDSLTIDDFIEVDKIDNLPNTILIDVKSYVNTPLSTVSTVSSIHEVLRNLYTQFGEIHCVGCGKKIERDFSVIKNFSADLKIDETYKAALEYIESNGKIISIEYFDKDRNSTTSEKAKALATINFTLNKIDEKIAAEFNSAYNSRIRAHGFDKKIEYDLIREIECVECHCVLPSLARSRFSFNTDYASGGGACRCCDGHGKKSQIKKSKMFINPAKSILQGASELINGKGIKHTAVTEKFIEAVYKKLGIDIELPIEKISKNFLDIILYGHNEKISFADRSGGKKSLRYEGLISYLTEAYNAGKGKKHWRNTSKKKLAPNVAEHA